MRKFWIFLSGGIGGGIPPWVYRTAAAKREGESSPAFYGKFVLTSEAAKNSAGGNSANWYIVYLGNSIF